MLPNFDSLPDGVYDLPLLHDYRRLQQENAHLTRQLTRRYHWEVRVLGGLTRVFVWVGIVVHGAAWWHTGRGSDLLAGGVLVGTLGLLWRQQRRWRQQRDE
jgi:hypothetical protein